MEEDNLGQTKLKYVVLKKDTETPAKIAVIENLSLSKNSLFPGCIFEVSNKEDVQTMFSVFRTQKANRNLLNNIKGVSIKLHKLLSFGNTIQHSLPSNSVFFTDISLDILYYGNTQDDKKEFYLEFNLLPEEMKRQFSSIQKIKKFGEKAAAHTKMWRAVFNDRKQILRLITNTVNIQTNYNLDIVFIPSPLLINREDIDITEGIYKTARKLYLGDTLDIEKENGRILALDLTLHKSMLKSRKKIEELLRSIDRIKPRGIKIKIAELMDLRDEKREVLNNWKLLMQGLGKLSFFNDFLVIYHASNVDGLVAQLYGIDCFIQTFNRGSNTDKQIKLSSETMKAAWLANPHLNYGKIPLYSSKEFVTRDEFLEIIKNGWPYPMNDIVPKDYETIKNMTATSFRSFSKEILVSLRNFEVNEIKNAIEKGDGVRLLKGKFAHWIKDLDLIT